MEEKEPKPKYRYHGSIFWPLLLVALGVVLLMKNVGGLNADTWDIILRLWPLIFIAGGLDSLLRRDGIAGPILGIGLGTIFLLSNFGLLAMNAWVMLLRIWPLFLVAIGLDIAIGRRSIWGALVAAVLILALLGGAVWYFGSDIASGKIASDKITQEFEGAKQVELEISPIVGALEISTLDDSKYLVEGSVRRFKGETIQQDFSVNNGKGIYKLTSSGTVVYPTGTNTSSTWKLGLSPQARLGLQANLVVGEMKLELGKLDLSSLETNVVIGKTTISLPAQGHFSAQIKGVIGMIEVIVPEGMEISINSDLGLANLSTPGAYTTTGDQYQSPGYSSGENQIDLSISELIGSVSIVQK